jgi:hypothetical protein
LPSFEQFKKVGETASSTLSRLSAEFSTLTSAATILGKSVAEANEFVKGASFADRTAFIDAAGGIDALNQKVSFFADNFLTEADRFAPAAERLNESMAGLGLNAAMSKDQFRDLVQSFGQVNGITEETLQAMLNLAPAFIQVKNAGDAFAQSAFGDLSKSAESERNRLTDVYNAALKIQNDRIQTVSESIGKLSELSKALKSTLSTLRPLSLGEAQGQIQSAINTMRSGGTVNASSIQDALSKLADQDTSRFSTMLEFQRSQAKSADLVSTLSGITDAQLTLEERSLSALEAARDRLTQGFENEVSRLDSIIDNASQQLGKLIEIKDLLSAQQSFGAAIEGRQKVKPISALSGAGNSAISDDQIRAFVGAAGRTGDEILAAAIAAGISESQYVAATGADPAQVRDFLSVRGYASGGFHSGGLRVVGENGPELEFTGPSRIVSNNDTKRLLDNVVRRGMNQDQNADIVKALRELITEIKKVSESSGKTAQLLDSVSGGGGAFLTEAA